MGPSRAGHCRARRKAPRPINGRQNRTRNRHRGRDSPHSRRFALAEAPAAPESRAPARTWLSAQERPCNRVTSDFFNQRYHRVMSDTPTGGPIQGASPAGSTAAPSPWPSRSPAPLPRNSGWLPFATLAIALVGLGVGIGAWLRPVPHTAPASLAPEPTYTDEQIATAKANICEAYRIVDSAVVINTHRTNPLPGDEVGALATGAHGVLALYASGDYLLDQLALEPATPDIIRRPIESLGNTLKKFGIIVLAGEPEPVRDPLRQAVDSDSKAIDGACK